MAAPAAKKRLFSTPYVLLPRYLGCYQLAFETGVVLGHAFRARLLTFAKLFSEPGREQELVKFMQQLAAELLQEIGEPKGFPQLAMFHEEARMKALLNKPGRTESQIDAAAKRLKVPLEAVLRNLNGSVSTGIGLGSSHPELTQRLWANEYECPIDRKTWQELRTAGVTGIGEDEPPKPISLSERQKNLLSMVELYVTNNRPELLSEFRER